MTMYRFPDGVTLTVRWNGVETTYPDGAVSTAPVTPENQVHGDALGIAAWEHRLLHELAHHVVAFALDDASCAIVRRAAHGEMQPDDAATREWIITAVEYHALGAMLPTPEHYGALIDLARADVHVPRLCARLRWLFEAWSYVSEVIV